MAGNNRRMRFKEPLGVVARRNVAMVEFLAGRPIPELRKNLPPLPVKRERAAPDPNDSEAPVLAAVGELLAVHPKVRLAVRQNSGAAFRDVGGRAVPVWFYRVIRQPEPLTLTDYWGTLTDGRIFAFECKRPSWRVPRTDREIKQWAFINMIVRAGGIGSFVTSADQAKALLP